MSFLDCKGYSTDTCYTDERLLKIKPKDIVRFLNKVAYNTEFPDENDRPNNNRSHNLYFIKKTITYYMPLHETPWDRIHERGNPTKSVEINNLIKKLKKIELRREGAPSNTVRPLEFEEFVNIISILRSESMIDIQKQKNLVNKKLIYI